MGLVAIILAATVFQVRRRRRQKRQRELENDIENAKTPKGKTRSQEKRRRTGSIHTVDGITEKQSDAVGAGDGRSIDEVIRKVFIPKNLAVPISWLIEPCSHRHHSS